MNNLNANITTNTYTNSKSNIYINNNYKSNKHEKILGVGGGSGSGSGCVETTNAFNSENKTDDAFNSTKELNDYECINSIKSNDNNKEIMIQENFHNNVNNKKCLMKIHNMENYEVNKIP
jgi:hypothetical protein